jgi:PAS domain S-box-containing protein
MAYIDPSAAAPQGETQPKRRSGRRLVFALAVLGLLCLVCAPFFADLVDHRAPPVRSGVADYSSYGALKGPSELKGDWRIVWRSAPAPGATFELRAPGPWKGAHSRAPTLPEQGAASYHVTLRGLQPGRYTLFVPSLYAGSRVTVGAGQPSDRGAAGAGPRDTRYLVRAHQVTFEADGSDLDVRIDVSAWFHRDNGLLVTPLVGPEAAMAGWATLDWIRSLLLMASLLLLGCYGVVVFMFRPQDRASLYFGLSCLFLLPLIGIFSHDNLVMIALPGLSFPGMLSLQYLTGALGLGLMLAYTHELFPKESPRLLYHLAQAAIGTMAFLYAAFAILGDTLALSQVSQACTAIRIGATVYVVLVVLAASIRRRDGAVIFLLGIGVFAGAMIYSDLVVNAVIPRLVTVDLMPLGTLLLLFAHLVILAERWSLAIDAVEHTNLDLRRLLGVNSALFSEVAAERNYNEDVLRSLSNGVVTLDADWRVAKLNEAAVRILGANQHLLQGADARTWLARTNPALLAEVEQVRESGAPKTLLEAELRTTTGQVVSANVSIVPLREGGASGGLLVIIDDITTGKRMQAAMRRFMTQKVVDQVLSREDEALFGVGCRASVLFADIRNFTTLAETLQPRATVEMLNEVYAELFEAVAANDGVLDKFLGDAVMAVYGAPISSGRDPQNAVASAVTMMAMVEALNARRRRRGEADLRLGIGIATGEVVAGTIGSPKRMDYTVIGDSVNLAARLQQVTKLYQVGLVVCGDTATALPEEATLRELDTIRVRGRQQPVRIFQVLTGPPARFTPALDAYRRGRDLLAQRRWPDAVKAFSTAVAVDETDHPSRLMLARAQALAEQPPGAEWDGVWDQAEAA